MCMTCFCKYHRGRLFGFKVELRGHWLCPYTVWLEPESLDRNPIARHTSSSQIVSAQRRAPKRMSITAIAGEIAGKVPTPIRRQRGSIMGSGKLAGRRNSYCMAQVARPVRSGKGLKAAVNRVREVWRGSSFNMETSLDTSPQAAPGQVQDIHPDLIARNMNLAPPPADNQV